MNKLKFILPLILATITLLIYRPIETQASTTQYDFNWLTNTSYLTAGGTVSTNNNRTSTPKLQIINNSIIINANTTGIIYFYNGNTYLGHYSSITNSTQLSTWSTNPTIPSNATHFTITFATDDQTWSSNFNQSTASISYSTPATAVPSENPTTFPNVTFIDNQSINVVTGMPENNNNFMRTDLIDIGSKSNLPTNFVFNGNDRDNTLGQKYPIITLFYDSNMELIYYTGREVRTSINGTTLGTRQFVSNLISQDNLGIVPANTKYIAYIAIKDYTGNVDNGDGVIINAASGNANFNDWQDYEFVTNLRLVKWGVQTTLAQGGGIVFFYSEYLPIGTQLETYTEDLLTDPNVAREGFEPIGFDGVTVVPSDPGPFEKLVIYQQLITYTVTFLDYDGTLLGTDTVEQGYPANPPLIPTRTGYTFTGWLPPIANVTGDITTTAQYTANLFQITWLSDNVIVKQTNEPYDSQILDIIPFVTKENHTLVGWIYSFDSSPVVSGLVQFAFTAEAVWQEVPTFTVTWRDPSFNTLKIEYVIESGLATAPNYDPGSGLILVGWTPDPTQPISANTTFIAVVQTAPTQPAPPTQGTQNATGLTDLFTGVFGAIVGSLMILGTIDLFGLQLSSLFWLFFAGTGFMMVWKLLRG
jgi:hypothetical protein